MSSEPLSLASNIIIGLGSLEDGITVNDIIRWTGVAWVSAPENTTPTNPLVVVGAAPAFNPALPAPAANAGYLYKKDGLPGIYWYPDGGPEYDLLTAGGGIPIVGASTDRAVVLWNGVLGDTVQDSSITISATGQFSVSGSPFLYSDGTNNSFGKLALSTLTLGTANTALGHAAGIGLTTGSSNTLVGVGATVDAPNRSNTIVLGASSTSVAADDSLTIGNNHIRDTQDGTHMLQFNTATGEVTKRQTAILSAGAAATPSLYFSADPNTGLYNSAADTLAFTTGGTQRAIIDSNGVISNAFLQYNNGVRQGVNIILNQVNNNLKLGTGSAPNITHLPVTGLGTDNTVLGSGAAVAITDGNNNTIVGSSAGSALTIGSDNIILGYDADVDAATRSGVINLGHTTTPAVNNCFVVRPSSVRSAIAAEQLYFDSITGEITSSTAISSVITNKVLYVAENGVDLTGTRNVLNTPYLTLSAALADALAGDLIVVYPGSYTVSANLDSSNVNWYFHPGATVTQTGGTDMFDVGAGVGGNVYGYGDFVSGGAYILGKNSDRNLTFEANTTTGLFARANTSTSATTVTVRVSKSMINTTNFIIINNGVNCNWDITCPYISGGSNGNPVIYTRGGSTRIICESLINTGTAYAFDNATGTRNNITADFATSLYVGGDGVINVSIVGLILCSGSTKFTGHCTRLWHINGSFIGGTVSYIDRYTVTSGLGTGYINTTLDTTTNTCNLSSTPTATDTLQLELRMLNGAAAKTFNIGNGIKLRLCDTWASHFNVFNVSGTGEVEVAGRYISYDALGTIPFVLTGTAKLLVSGRIEMKRNIPAISMVAGAKLIINGGVITTVDNLTTPIKVLGAAQNYKVLAGGFSTNYNGHALTTNVLERRRYDITAPGVASSLFIGDGVSGPAQLHSTGAAASDVMAAALVASINGAIANITASQDTPGVDTYFYVEADTATYQVSALSLINITETIVVTTSSYALTDLVGGLLIQDTDVE